MDNVDHWRTRLDQILQSTELTALELITALRALGAEMGSDNAKALLDAHPDILANNYETVRNARHEYIIENERLHTQQLLQQEWDGSSSFPEIANPFSARMYSRSSEIFESVDFSNCRQFVLVGCGWMPMTLFYVHDKTDVPELVGLDVVADAVATANEFAKRYGYGRVRAELHDGCLYDYRQSQIVYLQGMTSSKSDVLSRIADTAPEDVQVIVSEAYSLGVLWEKPVEPDLDPRFEIVGRGKEWFTNLAPTVGPALSRDIYLRRKENL